MRRGAILVAVGLCVAPWRASAHEADATDEEAAAEEPGADEAHERGSRAPLEVTVVAPQGPVLPASTHHVTAGELASIPTRGAEDALRLVPGLTLTQHGSEGKGLQIFLRGFDAMHGADFELEVEGIPLNEWSNVHAQGYLDLGGLPPELVASVEVVKGPFTLAQGAFATAGSADYHVGVREPERGVRATYTVGSTNRHRGLVSYSPRDGDGHDFVAAEALHDDGYGERRGVDRVALIGRTRLLGAPGEGELALLGMAHLTRFELPGALRSEDVEAGRVGFYDAYDLASRGLSGRAILGLSYEARPEAQSLRVSTWASARRLEVQENFTGFLVDPIHGDRRRQRHDVIGFGAKARHELRLSDRIGLESGLGLRGDAFTQSQTALDTQEVVVARARALDGVQTLTHGYVGLRWRALESLRVAAGSRLDVADQRVRDGLDGGAGAGTLLATSPRVGVEWRALAPWRLFGSYGRGFRPAEARAFSSFEPEQTGLSEDVYDGGDPRMTVADAFELGTRWSPSRFLDARLAGFATFVERESVYDHVSGVNLELNGTRRVGGELALRSRPVTWLDLHGDLTVVDARFAESGRLLPFAPWLVGTLRGAVDHPSGVHAGLRFLAMAPRALPHGARGAPLTTLDALVGYRGGRFGLDLALENLIAQPIRDGEYHYASDWRTGGAASSLPVLHQVAGPPFNARLSFTVVE